MATQPAASRLIVLLLVLFFLIFVQFGSADQTIRAESGQNVILTCVAAENKLVIVLEWSKLDLGENDHVALYRDDKFDNEGQNPAYRNRVDLQDREMKNGDVSLVLRNVTTDDAGKYECRVIQREVRGRKRSILKNEPICIVTLDVSAPGSKAEQKKDGGNEKKKTQDGGTRSIVIVGVSVGILVLALFAVPGFLLIKKPRCSPQKQNQPPAAEAELQAMNVENHPEPES